MATWNPWHGCTKVSAGCAHCYVYRRDEEFGRDASVVHKTASFNLPLRKNCQKEYTLQPDRDYVYTCFTSDFFHPDADSWRPEAWAMMKTRSYLEFYFVTKRPERFSVGLLLHPHTSTNISAALIGGTFGAIIPDIDCKSTIRFLFSISPAV